MASLIFPLQFTRQYAGPLDDSYVFDTLADMATYLGNDLRYPGQIVSCLEDGLVYKLNVAGDAWVSVTAGAGSGDVVGPATNTDNYVPQWSGADSKTLKDGRGIGIADTNLIAVDDATAADDEFARFTATGIEGLSAADTRTALNVADGATANTKATGAELDTGTDDDKFATGKSLKDSHNVPSVAPGSNGNILTSNGTDWTSAAPAAPDLSTCMKKDADSALDMNGYSITMETGDIYSIGVSSFNTSDAGNMGSDHTFDFSTGTFFSGTLDDDC